ncbi:MAG: OmpA family protein [Muribaculaceae bacterium]|nr:OmpA family protein [Muribaculaceae bacterium]
MKKYAIALALAFTGVLSVSAQVFINQPKFFDNWSIGIDGGINTPLSHNPFFESAYGVFGANLRKQLTPVFGTGLEATAVVNNGAMDYYRGLVTGGGINDSYSETYLGIFGTTDLFNLFGGRSCKIRPFTIETVIGAGWGRYFFKAYESGETVQEAQQVDFFGAKAGLNFVFNPTHSVSITIKPYVFWDLEGRGQVAFDKQYATFNLLAGLSYHFGGRGWCANPFSSTEIDELNERINALRSTYGAQIAAAEAQADAFEVKINALNGELDSCRNRRQVVKEESVSTLLSSVRFVTFRVGSKVVTADQMPNVEMIADHLKKHPEAKVSIKGYASKDGSYDLNIRLAEDRAQAVKNLLISKYKIAEGRILAEGQGIGDMFEEDSWNRVSICTLESAE